VSALRHGVLISAALLAGCTAKEPGRAEKGDIKVLGGYAYAPVGPEAAAYVSLQNVGKAEDTLLSVESSFAGKVTVHDSRAEGGAVRMIEMDRLVIPGGLVVEMAPGGLHLMLSDLRMEIPAGKALPLRLQFARAGLVEIEVPISKYGEPR
jgi:copper(I)-binding protein